MHYFQVFWLLLWQLVMDPIRTILAQPHGLLERVNWFIFYLGHLESIVPLLRRPRRACTDRMRWSLGAAECFWQGPTFTYWLPRLRLVGSYLSFKENLQVSWTHKHVKGHQDDLSEDLDQWALLNVQMDEIAKQFLQHMRLFNPALAKSTGLLNQTPQQNPLSLSIGEQLGQLWRHNPGLDGYSSPSTSQVCAVLASLWSGGKSGNQTSALDVGLQKMLPMFGFVKALVQKSFGLKLWWNWKEWWGG